MDYDQLAFMNDALIATGNRPVTTDDGSDEWIAASNAYERVLPLILYKHDWGFQTAIATPPRVNSSTYPGYTDIYEKPADCLHLENVWSVDAASMVYPVSTLDVGRAPTSPPSLDYRIIGDQIHTVASDGVTIFYVLNPGETGNFPPGFIEAVRRNMESLLYQGLNEDMASAVAAKKVAQLELEEARVRVDTENPRKVAFKSTFLEMRRRRMTGWWL